MPVESEAELRLREFVEADEAEVTSWFADAGELRFFAGPRLTWPLNSGQWRSIRLDPSVTAWTAELGESTVPVGHAELVTESTSTVQLVRLAVSPGHRAHGLGRAIVARLIEVSRENGYTLMTLNVHLDNTTAVRAYRSLGFEPSGSALVHASGRMELSLAV